MSSNFLVFSDKTYAYTFHSDTLKTKCESDFEKYACK